MNGERLAASLVVKVGGSEGVDLDAVCLDLAGHWRAGREVVLVHGGSAQTNQLLAAGEALGGGVSRVVVADARVRSPIAAAVAGRGTVVA